MCEPEIFIDTQIDIPLPYCKNNLDEEIMYNLNKNYRLRKSDIEILNKSVFTNEICLNAFNLIMKYMEDNLCYVGEERRARVGRLYNLLTYMLQSDNCLIYKKDIRLMQIFSYANKSASNMISKLISDKLLSCPLVHILNEYILVWGMHSLKYSRLEKYKLQK